MAAVETNEEFMARVMRFGCPTGPVIELFILEGLRKYCEAVVAKPAQDFDSPMVSGQAWVRTGQWLGEQLAQHLNMPFPAPKAPPAGVTTFSGFVTIEGIRTQVDFQASSDATRETLDSAFLDALAQIATVDYLEIGTESAQN